MVPLLQLYSNPSGSAISPQKLLFRSTQQKRQVFARQSSRRARQLRTNECEFVVNRYLEIHNIRTVALEFGVSRTTIARILTRQGIDTSRKMTEAEVAVATEFYHQGLSRAVIGKRLGHDNHTVLKELRKRGVEIRVRGATSPLKSDSRGQ